VLSPSLDSSVQDFIDFIASCGLSRACVVRSADGSGFTTPVPELAPIAAAISADSNYDEHEAAFFAVGPETKTLHSAFLHKTQRGQGAGGVRFWPYGSLGDLVRDGLRLSRGMGRKNALAGLHWGGGKGVICRAPGASFKDPSYRAVLYQEFGRFISSLRGVYVTAEDVGTTPPDMAEIFKTTRFTTCIPEAAGGSGNPSPATARGVVCAIEAAVDHLRLGSLSGKSVVLQGGGNVGSSMIADLLERDVASVTVFDVNEEQCRVLAERFVGAPVTVNTVTLGDTTALATRCDVLSPNALGAVLNPTTIPKLACKIICGAANNQLEDEQRDGDAVSARGVLYVPDFVANRMGIVNCANEEFGTLPNDPLIQRHFGRDWDNAVYVITKRILDTARERCTSTTRAAEELADRLMQAPHPMFPGRSRAIIASLLANKWHQGPSTFPSLPSSR
jgi:glutamate dehydrogenase/leucine dehydrogenase